MRNKTVYLLPNLLTTGNFFCGIFAIALSIKGDFYHAAWILLAGMLFDFFDGQIARMTDSTSRFGMEYDSLSDMVSFGLAPGILAYTMVLKGANRIGIAIIFIYSVCCALRLARFNVSVYVPEKRNFKGLPTPAACGFLAAFVILHNEYPALQPGIILPVGMLFLAFLMVSNIKYPSMSSLIFRRGKPFFFLVAIILATSIAIFHTEIFLFTLFSGYIAFGVSREVYYSYRAGRYVRRLGLKKAGVNEE